MITLITGSPGTGKSAALVSMLETIGKDRALYVNGIPDLKVPHVELENPSDWHNSVPDGSVIVIDEVQNVWRPRGPGTKVPEHVAKLETHRHRGLDFYIITQGPNLLDTNVRALTGRHVHLRDVGILGRWWYEWPECAENCRTGWKTAPIKKRYRLPKKIFDQYKSATLHVKPIRSFPRVLIILAGALVLAGFLGVRVFKSIYKREHPQAAASVSPDGGKLAVAGSGASAAPKFIDDRTAWVPRVSSKPESAPAYDEIRKVKTMPVVVGGICAPKGCTCYTSQGTDAGLTSSECQRWVASPPFNPYELAVSDTASESRPIAPVSPAPVQPVTVSAAVPAAASFDVPAVPPEAQRRHLVRR